MLLPVTVTLMMLMYLRRYLAKIIFDMTTVAALVEEHPILLFMTSSS